jgi:hypothetical protein
MQTSDSRHAHPPEVATDEPASPANPQPREAPDRLAFEPVPLRYREDGLTPERQRAYVEALADTGVAREAAARIGVSEQAINRVRRRADARSFDRACEAAHIMGARRLRSIAWERAIEGALKGHYYHGERVSEERVYDNRLLIYLLGKTAHLVEPPQEARAICDNWEPYLDALEEGLPPPDLDRLAAEARPQPIRPEFTGYELVEDEDGSWWTPFPPPEGFDGEEQGEFGDDDYRRRLSPREQVVLDADLDREFEEERASEAARRDRFFGFASGDADSSATEAEPNEPSGDSDGDEGPIEIKSAYPPVPGNSSPSLLGEGDRDAKRRGGGVIRNRSCPSTMGGWTVPRTVQPCPGDRATCPLRPTAASQPVPALGMPPACRPAYTPLPERARGGMPRRRAFPPPRAAPR